MLVVCDAQAYDQVCNLERDEGNHGCPHDCQAYCFGLHDQLRNHRVVSRFGHRHRDPVGDKARAAEVRAVEDASGQRAEDTADCMHAKHIKRIVRFEQFLQARDAPQANHACQ